MSSTLTNFLQLIFPSLHWRIKTKEKILYLTFDDGPIPVITPWVLEQLDQYDAKATFFCIGDNVRKHPEVYKMLQEKKHATGNHSNTHLNAWKTSTVNFEEDIREAGKLITSKLLRPPYGKITPALIKSLRKNYKIIMWDVLSADYNKNKTAEECFNKVKDHARSGSIIVFHDSLKAEERLRGALPKVLEYFTGKGYKFEAITIL